MKININKNRKRTYAIIVAASLLLATAGAASYYWLHQRDKVTQSSINYNPPTKEQKNAGEQIKEDSINPKENVGTPPSAQDEESTQSVSVVIADAGQYGNTVEVRALMPNLVEEGGTCTFQFSQDTSRLTKTSPTVVSASSTQCSPLRLDVTEFSNKGIWSLQVTYESSAHKGTSQSQNIEIR